MHLRTLGALGFALATATCDGGLEPERICSPSLVGICGRLTFTGIAPGATDRVLVLAFPRFPESCNDLLTLPPTFRPVPPVQFVPPFPETAVYALDLPPDRYEWVLAVWKKQGDITFTVEDTTIFREAGHYRDPADPAQPGIVTVPSGTAVGSVDFTLDLANLHPVTDFMPCEGGGP